MIVIFATEDDRHACVVASVLERDHNEDTAILDLSLFPVSTRLTSLFSPNGLAIQFLDRRGRRIDFMKVRSFWWRRPQSLRSDQRIADPRVQHFALQESISALYGILRCCPGLWVNDIEHDQNADFKPRQLAVMQRQGLLVPETLITNEPNEARAFLGRLGDEVIYKAFNQCGLIWLPTRRFMTKDLAFLDHLPCAPVIFQRYVEGIKDIRVTVIGDVVFATEFAIENTKCVDYRLIMGTAACAPHRLPPATEREVVALVRALNLEYGSVDLRLTRGGEYFFFEVNTAGEFLYLEDRTAQPIVAAMAEHLASGRSTCPLPSPAARNRSISMRVKEEI